MKYIWLVLLFIICLQARAQQQISGTETLLYAAGDTNAPVEYLKIGTDTSSIKPVLLFVQGSLPIPLIIDFGNFRHVNIPFNTGLIAEQFHLVVISMPETPVVASVAQLNNQYSFITDTSDAYSFRKEYLQANYLENYVLRTKAVLADLQSKSWADAKGIHLIGHSQGAKIAAATAAETDALASVSLLAFNAYGRFDELIRRERAALKAGEISAEAYEQRLNEHYQQWKEIQADPENALNGNKSWSSFSISYLPYLQKIKVPVFIGYGTEDISAENCDLLPLFFINNQMQNYTLKPYIGWDHNFFDINNRQAGPNWDAVITDVVEWIGNKL